MPVVSKTHRQDPMILRHVSACMLRFVKQMIPCFWYAIFPPSVILLSYYEGAEMGKFVSAQMQYCCLICIYCKFPPSDDVNMHKFKRAKEYSLYENVNAGILF